jgi:hypothetical protein
VSASVTAAPEGARAHAFNYLGGNALNPLSGAPAREGVSHPADLALIGDKETVAAGFRRYREGGGVRR